MRAQSLAEETVLDPQMPGLHGDIAENWDVCDNGGCKKVRRIDANV